MKTVKTFKYLSPMFDPNGGADKDVHNRVKIVWSKWRQTTGLMCDRNIPTQLKDKVYKTAIKPVMVYGAERWAVRKKCVTCALMLPQGNYCRPLIGIIVCF